jgi:hypothetical protein
MSRGRALSFGITDGARYSQYWTVKTVAKRSDVYLASERTGGFLHVSLHDPSYGSHMKVTLRGPAQIVPISPTRYPPGVIRVASLFVPPAALHYEPHGRPAVRWLPAPNEDEVWAAFEVLVEEPGLASETWWPGCSVGSLLVGRLDVSDGSTVVVVVGATTGAPGSATFGADSADLAAARATIASGTARALVQGRSVDGSLWFLELSPATSAAASEG